MAEKTSSSQKTTSRSQRKPTTKSSNKATAADVVDEQLERYRAMRNFSITQEPSGEHPQRAVDALPFCVQKHAASHLHYDFRLGWDGVLKSWAVAKGPSYFTGDKRLAVQVEDHPMEYGGFEGIIPKGQYGGGTVMLWDQGTWEPQAAYPDVQAGLREGSLKFILHGKKLKGKWALIRMKSKSAKESKPNWLLIKEHDELEQKQEDVPITESATESVITGRTMDEIARNEDHVWNSKDTTNSKQAWVRTDGPQAPMKIPGLKKQFAELPQARTESLPAFVQPQLAMIADVPPSGNDWIHELKLDGYRIQARKSGNTVQMLTRTGLDWTHRMATVAHEIAGLPIRDLALDGELVVLSPDGTTSFADLQASMQENAKRDLSYFVFDLLHADGKNLRDLPLRRRKELLQAVLSSTTTTHVHYSEHLETGGETVLREACKLGAEGIVSKRATASYVSGRSRDWIKTKCLHEQEFVVGGFTLPTNNIRGIGALLLGYYSEGKLIYAGKTGTGFTQKTHRLLRDRLDPLILSICPFEKVPVDARKGAQWVEAEVVAQVRFATWTADNLIRQAAFLGVREDKAAKEVVREEAAQSMGPRRARRASASTSNIKTADLGSPRKRVPLEHPSIRLTHPDKVLDTESGTTKQMLADYYWAIGNHMLTEINNRPVSLVRCPDGVGKESFFQKHVNATLPKDIGAVDVPDKKTGKVEKYITIGSAKVLTSLAQIGVLEIHPWGSQNNNLERPDRLVFDLDPDTDLKWRDVSSAAEEVRERLRAIGLESFLKTTGGKGLHVVVPIQPRLAWPEIKEFARDFVSRIEADSPVRYLTKMTKSARKGKIYLDYLRNDRGATSVAAYSPRARVGIPVSMPLHWIELKKLTAYPVFRVADITAWFGRLENDPWESIYSIQQQLPI